MSECLFGVEKCKRSEALSLYAGLIVLLGTRTNIDDTRQKSSSSVSKEFARLVPTSMINFISLLAQHNDSARHSLEGDFLDMLLRIYVVFPSSQQKNTTVEKHCLMHAGSRRTFCLQSHIIPIWCSTTLFIIYGCTVTS